VFAHENDMCLFEIYKSFVCGKNFMKLWNSKTIFFELKNIKKFTLKKLWMFFESGW
jgi:hypothetical protein